ncbi:related to Protein translocation protein SEC63 [Saccharomycodes ludwigii]|uniref:Related to Protein translocation protein SEC63 n=1 Tax=Saccharomycodes ludwigii TaxID=36035 RepID=A0A376BA94_9ASCO|nr:related to Protein translocation protein SEC63 [Saccharomycodes ludwigii]
MALNYDYDEDSQTWPFFLLTIALVILIPCTLKHFYNIFFCPSFEQENAEHQQAPKDKNITVTAQLKNKYTNVNIKQFRTKYYKKFFKRSILSRKTLIITVAWILISILIQNKINGNSSLRENALNSLFDPYELLGLGTATDATEKDIRSAYRKLSVKFHPDKLPQNLSDEERDKLQEKFVLITKAYKALTDELTRENYLKYGHPDGPQTTSHGIALPKFLVGSSIAAYCVIAFYIVVLGAILPIVVNRWWSKTKSVTKKGIQVETSNYFISILFNYKPTEIVTVETVLQWLSNAYEYKMWYPHLTNEDFYRYLKNHVNRVNEDDNEIKYRIVSKTHSLLLSLLEISCAFRYADISLTILETSKCIIQATMPSKHAQLLQLPNVSINSLKKANNQDTKTLGKLFTLTENDAMEKLGISNIEDLHDTLTVASKIPQLILLRSKFVVSGEPVVTPGAISHIDLKILIRSPKQKFIQADKFPEDFVNRNDELYDDFESQRDPFTSAVKNQPLTPYIYAPHFPVEKRATWYALVISQKDNKIIQTPSMVSHLSFANLSDKNIKLYQKTIDNDPKIHDFNPEDWVVGTIKVPFSQPAPQEKGMYFYRIVVSSCDYFGCDLDATIVLEVKDAPVEELKTSDDDELEDSDEDEESNAADEENEDEDYSSSEFTDIDTDTEEEEEEEEEEKKNNDEKEEKNKKEEEKKDKETKA